MPHCIDGNSSDAASCEIRSHKKYAALFARRASMSEDGYRPTMRWRRSRRKKEIEIDLVFSLHCRNTRSSSHWWNDFGSGFVIRRHVFAESYLPNHAKDRTQ